MSYFNLPQHFHEAYQPNNNNNNNKVDKAASLLKTCASLTRLKQLHAHIFRAQLQQNNSLASTIVSLYTSLSSPQYALLVFSFISSPTLSLFNHAIKAFSKTSSHCLCSLSLYFQMTQKGMKPDNYTYPFLFNSCAALSDIKLGMEIHGRAVRTGFGSFIPVSNALIDMYGKCNALNSSRRVFDEMPERDVVSYNALLGAHAKSGEDMAGAQWLFDRMPVRNIITWNALIVGYVNGGDLWSARKVFDEMPERNVVSWTTMVVGYTKTGLLDSARHVFEAMPEKNLISWTALITGYAQNGMPEEALKFFHRMESTARLKPDAVTMTSVISASAQLGDADLAHRIRDYVDCSGIERNEHVLTALLDMHAKCGDVEEAFRLFDEIPQPSAFSYSALITGLASNGHGIKALDMFHQMQMENIKPNCITFVGVLNACSHTGLVEQGLRFWESMFKDYGIEASADHYACMVDMLGRAGRLEQARQMLNKMPMGPHAGALGALLAACRTHSNVEIAEEVVEQLFVLEPNNSGNYMLLSSIYASSGRWEEAAKVRGAMNERVFRKLPGCSWIEDDTQVRGIG